MRLEWLLWAEHAAKRLRSGARAAWGEATGQGHLALAWRLRSVDGWFTKSEAEALFKSVLGAPGTGDVVEIGSWKGRSTIAMALALKSLGARARLYAIDPHTGLPDVSHPEARRQVGSTLGEFRRNLERAGVAGRVAVMVAVSSEAVPQLASRGVRARLAFVDGSHDERSVREDLGLVLPLLVPGGLVALHDCQPGGAHPDVWKVWQEDLAHRAEVVAHVDSLLVARPF